MAKPQMPKRISRRSDGERYGRKEKAVVGGLVVGLLACLTQIFGGHTTSLFVSHFFDYAWCSATERAAIASTNPADARHVLVVVDDLEDRLVWHNAAARVPLSQGSNCIAVPTEGPHLSLIHI